LSGSSMITSTRLCSGEYLSTVDFFCGVAFTMPPVLL
jgi:hypothetical protein